MSRAYRAKTILIGSFHMLKGNNRVSTFETKNVANWHFGFFLRRVPLLKMIVQRSQIIYLNELAPLFHRLVPGKLSLRLCPRLLGRMPTWQWILWRHISCDLCRHHQSDISLSKFFKINHTFSAIRFVRHSIFAMPDFFDGSREVTIPFHRVHA